MPNERKCIPQSQATESVKVSSQYNFSHAFALRLYIVSYIKISTDKLALALIYPNYDYYLIIFF